MKTVLEVIRSGSAWLEQRGVESARLNLEHLLAARLGLDRMQLYLRFEQPLDDGTLTRLREDLRRRAEGEPLQHLLGSVDFLGREFGCDARALVPRPETEVLVERCLELELPDEARVLDLATGSGVIGLSLAVARPSWRVSCTDVSPEALALARENAARLELGERVELVEGDLFGAVGDGERFELIVTNLPYIPRAELPTLSAEVQRDPALALDGGSDGLDLVRRVVVDAPAHLAPGGWIAFEVAHDQGEPVRLLLEQADLAETGLWSDLEGIQRFPWGRADS